jgi:hypothetical protein
VEGGLWALNPKSEGFTPSRNAARMKSNTAVVWGGYLHTLCICGCVQ